METNPQSQLAAPQAPAGVRLKAFGIGNAGVSVLDLFVADGFGSEHAIACDTDAVTSSPAAEKVKLESRALRHDPAVEGAQVLSEEQTAYLTGLCAGADVVFIIAGLGGATGTGFSPALAGIAKQTGALVLAFVTTPFECEGSRRRAAADQGLAKLQAAADGLICLPSSKVLKIVDETASVLETFKAADRLLADAVRGIWRLLTHKGLIEIHFSDLCSLLRDQYNDSAFAVAEAFGPTRSREILDRIFGHPLLDGGAILSDANAVLVSLIGGPDLTMAEVNRVMEGVNGKCDGAQVIMGAAIHEDFRDRLAVTLIASRRVEDTVAPSSRRLEQEALQDQLLKPNAPRAGSRFVPPPPTLPPEQVQQMFARQPSASSPRPRKSSPKMRQAQLPLEIVSKGRFDKSEPTIHKGEDLDVPTYIRRGVSLN